MPGRDYVNHFVPWASPPMLGSLEETQFAIPNFLGTRHGPEARVTLVGYAVALQ